MGTVAITDVVPDPEIFGDDLAAARNYVKARFGEKYTEWFDLEDDPAGQSLVSATDYMDRLGLVDEAGAAITHAAAPIPVKKANYELAVLINEDPDIIELLDQSFNIKSVEAGGAGVEFQIPTSVSDGSATQLPYVIQQLLGPYLPASSSTSGSYGGSGDCKSAFSRCREYDRKAPY